MRLLEVHTCPVWEEPDGQREVGFDPCAVPDHPPIVVGWCNVAVISLEGNLHRVLLTADA